VEQWLGKIRYRRKSEQTGTAGLFLWHRQEQPAGHPSCVCGFTLTALRFEKLRVERLDEASSKLASKSARLYSLEEEGGETQPVNQSPAGEKHCWQINWLWHNWIRCRFTLAFPVLHRYIGALSSEESHSCWLDISKLN